MAERLSREIAYLYKVEQDIRILAGLHNLRGEIDDEKAILKVLEDAATETGFQPSGDKVHA